MRFNVVQDTYTHRNHPMCSSPKQKVLARVLMTPFASFFPLPPQPLLPLCLLLRPLRCEELGIQVFCPCSSKGLNYIHLCAVLGWVPRVVSYTVFSLLPGTPGYAHFCVRLSRAVLSSWN